MKESLLFLMLGEVEYVQLEHQEHRLVLQILRLFFFKTWRSTSSQVL